MEPLRFEPADGDARSAASLARWLREDPTLRGALTVSVDAACAPGSMGVIDVVCAAVSSFSSLGGLAVAYAGWRDAHARKPAMKVAWGGAAAVTLDGSAEEIERLLRALTQASAAGEAAAAVSPQSAEDDE